VATTEELAKAAKDGTACLSLFKDSGADPPMGQDRNSGGCCLITAKSAGEVTRFTTYLDYYTSHVGGGKYVNVCTSTVLLLFHFIAT
jgi:hypothetical protein